MCQSQYQYYLYICLVSASTDFQFDAKTEQQPQQPMFHMIFMHTRTQSQTHLGVNGGVLVNIPSNPNVRYHKKYFYMPFETCKYTHQTRYLENIYYTHAHTYTHIILLFEPTNTTIHTLFLSLRASTPSAQIHSTTILSEFQLLMEFFFFILYSNERASSHSYFLTVIKLK